MLQADKKFFEGIRNALVMAAALWGWLFAIYLLFKG